MGMIRRFQSWLVVMEIRTWRLLETICSPTSTWSDYKGEYFAIDDYRNREGEEEADDRLWTLKKSSRNWRRNRQRLKLRNHLLWWVLDLVGGWWLVGLGECFFLLPLSSPRLFPLLPRVHDLLEMDLSRSELNWQTADSSLTWMEMEVEWWLSLLAFIRLDSTRLSLVIPPDTMIDEWEWIQWIHYDEIV